MGRSSAQWLLGLVVLGCADPPASTPGDAPLEQPTPSASVSEPDGDAEAPEQAQIDAAPASDGDVDPSTSPRPPLPSDGDRVYPKSRFVWVRPHPNPDGWVGYLWLGGSARLKSKEPALGPGCPGPDNNSLWYAIEPFGYVCVDGKEATLDAKDPELLRTLPYAPRLDSPWPHQYGESRGLQKYKQLPTHAEQRSREWDLPDHLAAVKKALAAPEKAAEIDEKLKDVDLTIPTRKPFELGSYPATLNEPRKRLLPLSTVAWSTEVNHDGVPFLLTADFMWAPKTRVAPYPKVTFKGLEIGRDVQLDDDGQLRLAFFRGEDRPKYGRGPEGFVQQDATFERLSWVKLTGKSAEADDTTFLETVEPGVWVKKREAVVPEFREETPWNAPVGKPDTSGRAPKGRGTWMEANVWKGWLVAYEGTRIVYVTMISPGRGGTPAPGIPPIDTAATPTGSFKITGKFATATMAAPQEFIHSDVPWTQNFSGPHALHGAYWHDNWGERMSAGCVNVSPRDGRWLFYWTEPQIPDGWHGVRWRPSEDPATLFIVR
ncbi:MAG: L,D-transpeptidase [Myxococcales bacterium]|nr:L,D-transpeptidase [Myxococcales bacterium]